MGGSDSGQDAVVASAAVAAVELPTAEPPASALPPAGSVPAEARFEPWPAARLSPPSGPPPGPRGIGLRRRALDALDAVSAWLPIALMAAMALGSWWLVRNSPAPEPFRAAALPRHEPDSTMNRFLVQRFAAAGPLRVEIEGERMRHYPDTDTYEIDAARLRAVGADGRVTLATARHALANRDASEVRLTGDAHVVQEGATPDAAIDFRGEFLDVFLATEQLRSHLPVVVRQGGDELHAERMRYDHLARTLELGGRVRAVLAPAAGRPSERPAGRVGSAGRP